ncbi:MAG: serine--tRNA ligase [Spirochaetaceae bacterium]
MLDLRFVRENQDLVQRNAELRNVQVDIPEIVELYDRRNSLLGEIESLRSRRNENARQMKQVMSDEQRSELIREGKNIKEQIPAFEEQLKIVDQRLHEKAAAIPNLTHPDVPVGNGEESNKVFKHVGTPPGFDFPARDHLEIGSSLDLLDFDRAAQISGAKFYYLKNAAVFLELGLIRYAMDILRSHGFTPMITPDIAREEVVNGIGFSPRGPESNIYTLEGDEGCLVGTAEITLGAYVGNRIVDADALPLKLAGFSHCFRREAGAAGQFSKGLYRVHQFSKVEMFVYTTADRSEQMLETLLSIEEEIVQGLEFSYRVVDTCTGDLGGPAYRKYDIEAWMPGRGDAGEYGEITSTSNCTDYQARRLGTRYRDSDGKPRHVHMLNGTAVAVSRALICILENGQQKDGSVRIPAALVPYCGFDSIEPRA